MILTKGDRVRLTNAGYFRMPSAAHHVDASERKPFFGVYLGPAPLNWRYIRVRVNGVVGSWLPDSWEKAE